MVLVGLGAAGSAGNASAVLALLLIFVEDAVREGRGDARLFDVDDDDAHGVWPGFAPIRAEDGAGRAGKILLEDVVDQLACRLADDREDCAVELFNFNTLDPP